MIHITLLRHKHPRPIKMFTLQVKALLVASLTSAVQVAHGFGNPSVSAIHRLHTSQLFATTSTSSITIDGTTTSTSTNNKLQVLSTISVTQNNGKLLRIRHKSESTKTDMTFSLFLPSSYGTLLRARGQSIPALYWLSKCIRYNYIVALSLFLQVSKHTSLFYI